MPRLALRSPDQTAQHIQGSPAMSDRTYSQPHCAFGVTRPISHELSCVMTALVLECSIIGALSAIADVLPDVNCNALPYDTRCVLDGKRLLASQTANAETYSKTNFASPSLMSRLAEHGKNYNTADLLWALIVEFADLESCRTSDDYEAIAAALVALRSELR